MFVWRPRGKNTMGAKGGRHSLNEKKKNSVTEAETQACGNIHVIGVEVIFSRSSLSRVF